MVCFGVGAGANVLTELAVSIKTCCSLKMIFHVWPILVKLHFHMLGKSWIIGDFTVF